MTARVVAGLKVLRVVADRRDPTLPLAVGETARRLGLALSRVSRLCSELEAVGLLEHAGAYGAYRLGPAAVRLSGRAAAPCTRAVRQALTLVAQWTGETTCLAAPTADGMRIIASVRSVWTLQSPAEVGELVTDRHSAVARAAREQDDATGAVRGRHLVSRTGMRTEMAVPVLNPADQCVAVLAVRLPVSRSAQGLARARRALGEARRVVESGLRDAADGPARTRAPAPRDERAPTGLEAAFRILRHLAEGGDRVAGVALSTGLRPDRTRRLVDSCARAGFIRFGRDRGDVRLSWDLHGWHRAFALPTMLDLGEPLVAQAAHRTGGCAYITVLHGMGSLTVVEKLQDVGEGLSMVPWLGRLAPVIGSDAGPTLVMDLDDRALARMLPDRHTPQEVEAFLRRARLAARDGVLSMESIDELGIISVSAPVRDSSGTVVAAACLVGAAEFVRPRVREFEDEARGLASRMSALLGAP